MQTVKYRLLIVLILQIFCQNIFANPEERCTSLPKWARHFCMRLNQVWTKGNTELYLTGYAWHNRYTYSPEKINEYNELALGGGVGKGFYDEDGDWHGLTAFAFLDSHKNVEPVVGYAFLKVAHLGEDTHVGAGYSVFVTARHDIFNNIPFPGVLPWVSGGYRRVTLMATYIPGAQGAGNVLFIFGKWTFEGV